MNQVAVVGVVVAGCTKNLATYLNGSQVSVINEPTEQALKGLKDLAESMAQALDLDVQNLEYPIANSESDWEWKEIQQGLINSGKLAPPLADRELMKGFYRCPECFTTWEVCDEFNEAQHCRACSRESVEPYFSGHPRSTSEDAIHGLADHERRYPDPTQRGEYMADVTRLSFRNKLFTIPDAVGPADAHLKALTRSGDEEFPSESSATYEVNFASLLNADS